jgi:hypothetical protein
LFVLLGAVGLLAAFVFGRNVTDRVVLGVPALASLAFGLAALGGVRGNQDSK